MSIVINQEQEPAVLLRRHQELMDSPLEVLHCISAQQAQLLKTVLDVATIRDICNHKLIQCLCAFKLLEQQMVAENKQAVETICVK